MSWKRFPGACQPDAGQKFAGWPRVVRGDTADGVWREGRQYDPAFDKTYFLPACSLQVGASPRPLSVLSLPAVLSPTQRSKQVGCPVGVQLLLACSPAWRSGRAFWRFSACQRRRRAAKARRARRRRGGYGRVA